MTKYAFTKAVVSGQIIEHYEYEKPYFFNHLPLKRVRSAKSNKNARRDDNLFTLREKIRRLVDTNFQAYGYDPVFLTFTFRDNVTDLNYANKEFNLFIKRLNYELGYRTKWLNVVEFQKRGSVHYHAIFFNLSPEIERREREDRYIARIWTHGFIDIERVRSARRVGPYVCKYLNKGLHDERLQGRRGFFTSLGLFRPVLYRYSSEIDKVLDIDKVNILSKTVNTTKYGNINYNQYDQSISKVIRSIQR